VKSAKFVFDFSTFIAFELSLFRNDMIGLHPIHIWYNLADTTHWTGATKSPLKNGLGKLVQSSVTQSKIVRFADAEDDS